MDPTLAEIRLFGGNFAPVGWALCQGQLMSIAENTALFSLLGTTYGGDGQVTFALPDFRGRIALGTGQGPGLSFYDLGEVSGSEGVTIVSTQMPAHIHTGGNLSGSGSVKVSSTDANQTAATAGASVATPGSLVSRAFTATLGFNTTTPDTNLNTGAVGLGGVVPITGAAGGSQPHENIQPYLALNFIICTEGIYPSRN